MSSLQPGQIVRSIAKPANRYRVLKTYGMRCTVEMIAPRWGRGCRFAQQPVIRFLPEDRRSA